MASRTPPYVDAAFAEKYAASVDDRPYNALYERPAMLSLLPAVANLHILDAGCGAGWYSERLLTEGARVTAVDVSESLIAHVHRRLSSVGAMGQTDVRVADLSRPLTFLPDKSVDGVLSALALHYIEDWGATFLEFHRVLRPGGWLLFSTHHPWTEATLFNVSRYFDVELVEDYWDWLGTVTFFRRPLTSIFASLIGAGFAIDRVVEPMPTDAFRAANPDAFLELLRAPAFLLIRAVRT